MSRGVLLDTNVPSELTRPQPSLRVAQWLENTDDDLMHIGVITIGEVCKGITVHPEEHRRAWLRQWLENELRPWFAGRILPVTEAISERWGILEGDCQLKGINFNAPDGLIAATALEHDLTLVTRNVKHFAGLGVAVFNPWDIPWPPSFCVGRSVLISKRAGLAKAASSNWLKATRLNNSIFFSTGNRKRVFARSSYGFAVSAEPITSLALEAIGQHHFDIGLKRRGQLFSECSGHAPGKRCVPPGHAHQGKSEKRNNNCRYRLNPCGVFIQPLHFRSIKDTGDPRR